MSETGNKTTTGLQENVAGLLCYVLGWISGIVFLIIERENKFIRFHAIQSIIVFGVYTVVTSILGNIPIIGWIFNTILGIIALILWIILMIKAYQGKTYKVLWAGNLAERLAK